MALALGVFEEGDVRIAYPELRLMRTPWMRAIGLIGRSHIKTHRAYLFAHCPSVHTFFMRCAIDVIICDKNLTVLAVETLCPWRSTSHKIKGARIIIEVAEGTALRAGITRGTSLAKMRTKQR